MEKESATSERISRVLSIYTRLMDGELVSKSAEAERHNVNGRTIQRDIDDIRNFLDDNADRVGYSTTIVYDHGQKGYHIERSGTMNLSNSEILAVCKILLDSRAFTKRMMSSILDRLVSCCSPREDKELVRDLIKNEAFHYVEPHHRSEFLDRMWDIGIAIRETRFIEMSYYRTKDKSVVKRKIKPLAIMFSEYYFYLTAFLDEKEEARKDFDVINDSFPTIYRIDRIRKLKVLDERFYIPYRNRFEEGEFRKRIQFMYGGKLKRVKFKYSGTDIDAILDRLPTAEVLDEEEDGYIVQAEVFGTGIDMWIRSQGDYINLL